MKKQNRSLLFAIASLFAASALPLSAVNIYSTDFDSYTLGALGGQDSWTATGVTVETDGSTQYGSFTGAGATATHGATGYLVDPSFGDNGAGSLFEVDFGVIDGGSASFNFEFGADFLTLSLTDNGVELLASWTTGGPGTLTDTVIPYATLTTLSVLFVPSGADVFFTAEFVSGNTVGFNGTLAGLSGSDWTGFGIDYDGGAGQALLVDNLSLHSVALVPEPGSLALAGLALSGLVVRRRRS